MLSRIPKTIWFLLGGVLLIGFVMLLWWSSIQPPHHEAAKAAADAAEAKTVQDIAAEAVAYYTKVLAWFTGVLAAISLFQGCMLYRADKTTRIAANAAKRSAEAAISVEIARVLINNLEFQWSDVANLYGNLQFPKVTVSVKNYGRTPAFVGQQSSDMLVAPALPAVPDYPNAHDLIGCVIEGGTTYGLPIARLRSQLSLETIKDIAAGKTFIWVYGYLFYRDFLHDPHWLRFCGQVHVYYGEGYSGPVRVIEGGPEKYTESY